MFEKRKLRKQIQQSKDKIYELEQRRARSQAALVSALLKHEVPRDEDVDYFNHFSAKIDEERDHLRRISEEYEALLHHGTSPKISD